MCLWHFPIKAVLNKSVHSKISQSSSIYVVEVEVMHLKLVKTSHFRDIERYRKHYI